MPESSATSKATKNLVADVETSTEVKKTSAAAEKTTEKKTTAEAKKTSAAAVDPSEFQNAQTSTEKATTSTHAATSTHSTPAATVSSKVPSSSSSMVPITMSTPSSSLASTTSASALPSATTANASSSSSPSVAGPVVGSIAGIAVVGAIAFFFIRRRNKNKKTRATHAFSQFLNEAPPHHGTGNARDSMWGMPAQAGEKDVNNGYAISPPPPPPEKAYNPDFGSPPPMSPPTAYSAYDPQHHVPPPTSPNGAGYGGQAPQAEYGNVSPTHMDHNAAIAGAAVAGAAVGGAMAHHHHQQQYPNEVNGDMPLAAPTEPMSPQSPQQQGASDQQNAYYQQQQSPQQQHPELAGQQDAYYHQQQSPQQQHSDVSGQQNAYYSPPQEFQQQPGVGYNQPYPGYPQGYQQGYQQEAQQYYDPNSQQYGYSAQPYAQYNSMYIGAEHSYFQGDSEYTSNYPAVAAASAFGQSENAPEHQQQHSYEMMPQPTMTQPPTTANQAEPVPTTSQPEQSRDVQTPNSTAAPNSVTPAPTLLTNDIGQSTPSTEHYVDHTTPAEQQQQQPSHSEPAGNPYVLDVPIEYNNDPARETLYGLSEHYQYGGEDKDDGQELSSGHQNTQPPHPPAHKGDLM